MLRELLNKFNQELPGEFGLFASIAKSTAEDPRKIPMFLLAVEPAPYVELSVLVMVKVLLKVEDKSKVMPVRVPKLGSNCVKANCLVQSVNPETESVNDIVSALARVPVASNKATASEIFPVIFVIVFFRSVFV